MTQRIHPRAKEIFLTALDLDPAQRAAHLQQACGHETALLERVQALLDVHERAELLERWIGSSPPEPLSEPARDAAPSEEPIALVGDYELLEEVASGAMGTVYRARQTRLDRTVALKVLRVGRFATALEVRRFRAEAEAAARLDHPHIVPVYDVGEYERRHYFSMKLIEGPSLADALDRFEGDPRAAAKLVATVSRAVHHAHQHGVLHRDLKPSNILLDAEGAPHVADFGIAKRVDSEADHTRTGIICGTPAYMAPEQAVEDGEVTVASDVYSLGCVLYEVLSGRPPFQATTLVEILRKAREEQPARLSSARGGIARDLETICFKCLAKEPERRYQSAQDLALDLERWLDHMPIHARPISLLERVRLHWRRKPLVTGLVVAVAGLVVVLAVGATVTSLVLGRALKRTGEAEQVANERLRGSLLAQARANRRGNLPGRRYASLELLSQAAAIEPGIDLVNEAITCLTLVDLREDARWTPAGDSFPTIGFDDQLERSARGTTDGALQVRSTTGDQVLLELPPSNATTQPHLAVFSPDGTRLAVRYHGPSFRTDAHVVIWDLERKELLRRIPASDGRVIFAWDPGGSYLAVCDPEGVMSTYDGETFEELDRVTFSEEPPNKMSIRPDGRRVAVTTGTGESVAVIDLEHGELVFQTDLGAMTRGVAWAQGGTKLVVGCYDHRARVLDAETGEFVSELRGHSAEVVDVTGLAHSLVATVSWDETTRFWDLRTGETQIVAREDLFASSSDGQRLAFSTRDEFGLWSIEAANDCLQTLHGHTSKGPDDIDVDPSGRWMASCDDDGVLLWSIETAEQLASLYDQPAWAVMFEPDGGGLLVASDEGLFRWALPAAALEPHETQPELLVEADLGYSGMAASGACVALRVGRDLLIHTLGYPEQDLQIEGYSGMDHPSLSPNGELVATSSWRGSGVHVWNAETGEPLRILQEEEEAITAIFDPSGEYIVTGTSRIYSVWRIADWSVVLEIPREFENTDLPGELIFDPWSDRMAYSPTRGVVELARFPSGEVLARLEPGTSHPIADFVFLPEGRGLANSVSSRRIFLWDFEHIGTELAAYGLLTGSGTWLGDDR